MSVILGGITLNPSLVWVDKYAFSPAKHSYKRTLGGGLVVNSSALVYGRPITLEAREDQGWFTYSMVQGLYTLSVSPDTVYNLQIGGEVFSAMFRHGEPPAFEAHGLIERSVSQEGDYFTGVIKLITV